MVISSANRVEVVVLSYQSGHKFFWVTMSKRRRKCSVAMASLSG